ncbi:MAG: hypothetical protein JXQ90_23035 [Cyclobacteriaceae bacterium]
MNHRKFEVSNIAVSLLVISTFLISCKDDDIEPFSEYHENAWIMDIDNQDESVPGLFLNEECTGGPNSCTFRSMSHDHWELGSLWFDFELDQDNELRVNYFGNLRVFFPFREEEVTWSLDNVPSNVDSATFSMILDADEYELVSIDYGPPVSFSEDCTNECIVTKHYIRDDNSLRAISFRVLYEGKIIFELNYDSGEIAPTSCISPDQLHISSQETINQFSELFPGCKNFGSIGISGELITDLSGLKNIDSIGTLYIGLPNLISLNGIDVDFIDHLEISNSNLTDLKGIEDISIGSGLTLYENEELLNFQGFNSPDLDYLNIYHNPKIGHLTGLETLYKIGSLSLYDNELLMDLNGLDNLESAEELDISNNPLITNFTSLYKLSSLRVFVINGSGIENLSGLEGIEIMESVNLTNNDRLQNLRGLDNLTSVQNLTIEDNESLADIRALSNLSSLEELRIYRNPRIENLQGMENINSLGALFITDNENLKTLNGIENLTFVDWISIVDQELLSDLNALSSLVSVGTLGIRSNEGLLSLTGLESLTNAQGITISDNLNLTNLNGFQNLKETRVLTIQENAALINIDGLNNLTTIHEIIEVGGNQSLSNCAISIFCETITNSPEKIIIYNNGSGCNSETEVIENCN